MPDRREPDTRPVVLVAHSYNAEFLAAILEQRGFAAPAAAKFDEAVMLAKLLRPSVIVTHMLFGLSEIDWKSVKTIRGVEEFVAAVRAEPALKSTRLIIFSISKKSEVPIVDDYIAAGGPEALDRLVDAINRGRMSESPA